MALRSGYKGFKRLINGLKVLRPGVLGIDIGTGLAIGQDGKLNVTGVDVTVAGNPEEAATAGDLTKLQIGDDIFNVPDTTYSNATTTEAGLMSADDKEKLDTYGEILPTTTDLNDLKTTGVYFTDRVTINVPSDLTSQYFGLIVTSYGGGAVRQMILAAGVLYLRSFGGSPGAWSNWFKFTGTEIVPTP